MIPTFSHANIIKYTNRPFANIEEMNLGLIENWNSVVKPDDTVFHLGDVALGKIAESLPLIGLLNGHKILVPGNHDRIFSGEKQKSIDRYLPEYEAVFQEIMPEISHTLVGRRYDVVLSHFPYSGDHSQHARFLDKRPKDNGVPLLHGHVHTEWKFKDHQFNVGVDAPGNNYYPIHEDEVVEWIESL